MDNERIYSISFLTKSSSGVNDKTAKPKSVDRMAVTMISSINVKALFIFDKKKADTINCTGLEWET